jgi:iron complex outermembrane recepter protein
MNAHHRYTRARFAGFGLALGLMSAPAMAQIEEIVVTARKKAENLQSVPLSITAFSGEMIERAGLNDIKDIALLTPGLNLFDFGGGNLSAPVIRGLSLTNTAQGESNVAVFLDGIYLGSRSAINVALVDLERVEVVKGPQSALYGRNAFAGAINYVTRKAGSKLEGNASLTLGSDGNRVARAAVGGPIVAERLFGRISLGYDHFDGTWEDKVNGRDMGGWERWALQTSLVGQPSDALRLEASLHYADDDFGAPAYARIGANCASGTSLITGQARLLAFCGRIPEGKTLDPQAPLNSFVTANQREAYYSNLKATLSLDALTIESLTGYNDFQNFVYRDFYATRSGEPFPVRLAAGQTVQTPIGFYFGDQNDTDEFSQELRLSAPEENSFRWQVGGFYYKQSRLSTTPAGANGAQVPAGGVPTTALIARLLTSDGRPAADNIVTKSEQPIRQKSAWLDLDADVTSTITLGASARYTEEYKRVTTLQNSQVGPAFVPRRLDKTFTFWDYRFTAQYQPSDDLQMYASAARGTKAGGFNAAAVEPVDFAFDPESNWTYEAGLKSSWLDKRLQANVSVYYIDWTDIQFIVPNSNPALPGQVTRNFGSAKNKGTEVEIVAELGEGVSLTGGLAYTDPTFKNDAFESNFAGVCAAVPACAATRLTRVNTRPAIRLEGLSLFQQSDWQSNLVLDVERALDIDEWRWFGRATVSYQSARFADLANFGEFGPREIVNLRAGIRNDMYELTAWVDNLADDTGVISQLNGTVLTDATTVAGFGTVGTNLINGMLPQRRTWGVTGRMRF